MICPVKAISALKQQLKQTLARECSEILPAYSPSRSELLTLSSLFEPTTESKILPFLSGMRAGISRSSYTLEHGQISSCQSS